MTVAPGVNVRAVLLGPADAPRLGPAGSAWAGAAETALHLEPTPLDRQPSAYVQAAWRSRAYGSLPTVGLTAAVAGASLFLRLRWQALEPRSAITDTNVFADAAAVLFPLNGVDAPLETMGDTGRPVQAWQWRAGTARPFVVTATGLGTATRAANHGVEAEAAWDQGQWTTVFSRPLDADGLRLPRGGAIPCGVAVWCGARDERAGLKSHTPGWVTLALP